MVYLPPTGVACNTPILRELYINLNPLCCRIGQWIGDAGWGEGADGTYRIHIDVWSTSPYVLGVE